jgi:hypothetical protein
MRGSPRPYNNSRPNITCLLLEGDGTLLDILTAPALAANRGYRAPLSFCPHLESLRRPSDVRP